MSTFNRYARRLDSVARKHFDEIQEKEAVFKKAEQIRRETPKARGIVDAQVAAKSARAEADYLEAKAAYDMARRDLPDRGMRELQVIRAELVDAVNSAFTVDPSNVDTAALELMKSGICTAKDYEKLFADVDESNTTMIRLIADFAKKAYETARNKAQSPYREGEQEEISRLYAISTQGQSVTEKGLLANFDALTDIFRRCMNNTSMIDCWEELALPVIENF